MLFWGKPKWDPAGKRCFVPGGSSGLGLAFSKLLVQHGAHVAIVARDEKKLANAKSLLEVRPFFHILTLLLNFAFSLASLEGSQQALEEAAAQHDGRAPDAIFTCAGLCTPGYFLEMGERDLQDGMTNSFWVQAYPANAGAKMMAKQGVKGKICFVSSTLGYMGLLGYASYSPGKHALMGLVESLRFELALYDIDVQVFAPCTMYSPGYENEQRSKPTITKKIEESDEGLSPEQAARAMLAGIQKGHAHFAGDLIKNLFRVSTRGSAPNHNIFVDTLLQMIAWPGVPIWRWMTEGQIEKYKEAHLQEMREKGLVE